MSQHDRDRRLLLSALAFAPFAGMFRPAPAAAQSGAALPPIVQPTENTKFAFLARARALREQQVREGDQAYGAVVVRDGIVVASASPSTGILAGHGPRFSGLRLSRSKSDPRNRHTGASWSD
jgi:hypothetical protein